MRAAYRTTHGEAEAGTARPQLAGLPAGVVDRLRLPVPRGRRTVGQRADGALAGGDRRRRAGDGRVPDRRRQRRARRERRGGPRAVGFAHHDPFDPDAARELRRAVTDLGLRGYKIIAPNLGGRIDDPVLRSRLAGGRGAAGAGAHPLRGQRRRRRHRGRTRTSTRCGCTTWPRPTRRWTSSSRTSAAATPASCSSWPGPAATCWSTPPGTTSGSGGCPTPSPSATCSPSSSTRVGPERVVFGSDLPTSRVVSSAATTRTRSRSCTSWAVHGRASRRLRRQRDAAAGGDPMTGADDLRASAAVRPQLLPDRQPKRGAAGDRPRRRADPFARGGAGVVRRRDHGPRGAGRPGPARAGRRRRPAGSGADVAAARGLAARPAPGRRPAVCSRRATSHP